jgi:hypothetical protein
VSHGEHELGPLSHMVSEDHLKTGGSSVICHLSTTVGTSVREGTY